MKINFLSIRATQRLTTALLCLSTSLLSAPTFFSQHFPAAQNFRDELNGMRAKKKILPTNDTLIQRSVLSVSKTLTMPPAILWCLFFQESRLNHLYGLQTNEGARGLGQFITPTFYEINYQLGQFDKNGTEVLIKTLGRDVRPIEPKRNKVNHPSSYFYIPTAVTASALYLNNRYVQLGRTLERQDLRYNPDLLWIYSVMAYNKGARSVLIFWNQYQAKHGKAGLEKILTDPDAAREALANKKMIYASLAKIWSSAEAARYADEAKVHLANIQACSLTDFEPGT